MTSPSFFRVGFFTIFTLLSVMRLYYRARAGLLREPPPLRAEGNLVPVVRVLFGVPLLLATLCYCLAPQRLSWMTVPLPATARLAGLALGLGALLALWSVHHALGNNFTTSVVPKAHHTLVQTGPYRWVRHPMYSSYLLLFVAAFLVSENAGIGLMGTAIILSLMTLRLRKEEALLIERFGEKYRSYMKTTRKFFPAINPRSYLRRAAVPPDEAVRGEETFAREAHLVLNGGPQGEDA
ncbi:MAG: isoprenylcysteine carboxylmethyltransferase family protein [bacterium]|jgi:protein-S-isoprenylcysteine O-methyltransferase Ste14|nr:isoprenylcysteine carboxylmethyltransferase family protein [candidate division KSB1 bacterium]MDH7560927.1 isoprenylcysteine carboxylmethyltransferase family protein [bacterium]